MAVPAYTAPLSSFVGKRMSSKKQSCGWPRGYIPKKGKRFGSLTVVSDKSRVRRYTQVRVVCVHGFKEWVYVIALKTGNTKTCRMWNSCNIPTVGTMFGSLKIVSKAPTYKNHASYIDVE
jgi:hypothetical protein